MKEWSVAIMDLSGRNREQLEVEGNVSDRGTGAGGLASREVRGGNTLLELQRERQRLVFVVSVKLRKERKVAVRNIIDKCRDRLDSGDCERVFFKPNIPKDKLRTAIDKYAQDLSPNDVLVLVDDSALGSAKEGVLMTSERLFFRNVMESPRSLSLREIENLLAHHDRKGRIKKILVNGEINISVATLNPSSREILVELICSLCNPLRGNHEVRLLNEVDGQDDHLYNFTVLLPPFEGWLQAAGLSEYDTVFEELKEKGGNREYEDYDEAFLRKNGIDDPVIIKNIIDAIEDRNRDLHDVSKCRIGGIISRHLARLQAKHAQELKELMIVAAKPYVELGNEIADAFTDSSSVTLSRKGFWCFRGCLYILASPLFRRVFRPVSGAACT